MAWKRRGDRMFYYRSRRQNGKVVTEYVGCGALAEAAARLDALQRSERVAAKLTQARDRQDYERISQAVTKFCDFMADLTAAGLLLAGGYRHSGVWRCRRDTTSRTGTNPTSGQADRSSREASRRAAG